MDNLCFLLAPQASQTYKDPLNPRDNCHLKIIKCVQVKSQPHCEACKTSNLPCQFRDEEHYFSKQSRILTGSSVAPSWRSSSQSIELSAVNPALGNSVNTSGWYWGAQALTNRGHPSSYASGLPSYNLSLSPQSSLEQWFSLLLMGPVRPPYKRWATLKHTSPTSALQQQSLQLLYLL
ncbi:hypothetical protein V8E53_000823 [Lactarius tabidus]